MGGERQLEQRLFAESKKHIVIVFEHGLEWLTLADCRVLVRQLMHTIKGEKELYLKRLPAPECPVLSNVAMRPAGATISVPPCFVTRATKSRIADLAALSFQEGSD